MINVGETTITATYFGETLVSKIYYGEVEVYSTSPSDLNDNNAEELTATNIYKATGALKYGTTEPAVNGDSIGRIPDLKGESDLIYRGVAVPEVIGAPPKLKSTSVLVPSIRFVNVPNLDYQSDDFTPILYPHALGFVFQSLPTQTYEAWINDYGSRNYIGNSGTVLRVWAENAEVQGNSLPEDMEYSYLHVEYKADVVDVYINGELRGSIANPLGSSGSGADLGKVRNALAVYTNNADFNWMAEYIWTGEDYTAMIANRQVIMDSICNKYSAGYVETNPYASNVQPILTDQTYGIAYTSNNSTNPSATQYEWWLRIRTETSAGEFAPQVLVGTDRDLPASVIQSYVDADTAVWLTPYVKQDGVFEFIRGAKFDIG